MNIYIKRDREIITTFNQIHYHINEVGFFGIAVWDDMTKLRHRWVSDWYIRLEH